MISSITRFFESCLKAPAQETGQHSAHRLQLASAALLMELCVTDQDFSNEEMHTLRTILQDKFGLSGTELDTVWKLAREEASNATSLYQFTSLFNEQYDYAAKTQLLSYMWQIAYADGRLDRYEEHTIRKVADLLYLSHKDFIQTKKAARPEGYTGL